MIGATCHGYDLKTEQLTKQREKIMGLFKDLFEAIEKKIEIKREQRRLKE